ncbi:hypothetical protein [Azospirillum argentinense]|uniref:helix-turn-helix domain-containing protein n=1 Tax=Azospirillum argentinense TaxID=2970906 RepID=UPI0032DEF8D9
MTRLAWAVIRAGCTDSDAQKLVLLRLSDFADDDGGSIFPAVATVAADCGVSPRTVQYTMRKMEDKGWLLPVSNAKGGRGRTRQFALAVETLTALAANAAGQGAGAAGKGEASLHPLANPDAESETVQRVQAKVHPFPEKGASELHPSQTPQTPQRVQATVHPFPQKGANGDSKGCNLIAPEQPIEQTLLMRACADAHVPAGGREGARELVRETTPEAIVKAFDAARVAAFGAGEARRHPHDTDFEHAAQWIAVGADLDLCEGVFVHGFSRAAALKHEPPHTLKYFHNRVVKMIAAQAAPFPDVEVRGKSVTIRPAAIAVQAEPQVGKHARATRAVWRIRLEALRDRKMWLPSWMGRPGEPDYEGPQDLVAEVFRPAAEPTFQFSEQGPGGAP